MSREFWATVSVGITVIAVTVTGFAILSGRIDALENRLDARITTVESNFDARDTSLETSLGARITSLETNLGARIASVEADLGARITSIDDRMHEMNTRLSRIEGRLGLPDEQEQETGP